MSLFWIIYLVRLIPGFFTIPFGISYIVMLDDPKDKRLKVPMKAKLGLFVISLIPVLGFILFLASVVITIGGVIIESIQETINSKND